MLSEAARTKRAHDDGKKTMLRRMARRHLMESDAERARGAQRETAEAAERAQQVLAPVVAASPAGATAARSPLTSEQDAASRRKRLGDDAFLPGSVACMASQPRMEFSSDLAVAVVGLVSVKKVSLQGADALSVERTWASMDNTTYSGQKKAVPTLAFVKAMQMAHDGA